MNNEKEIKNLHDSWLDDSQFEQLRSITEESDLIDNDEEHCVK